MAIEKIEIVIIGKDKGGTKVIKKQKDAIDNLNDGVKTAQKTFAKFTLVAVLLGVAIKKAFDFGRRGAVVRQTTAAFTSLMGGVEQAEIAMMKFQEVSAGTISKIEIMAAVTTVLAGTQGELRASLQTNAVQLLKIAKAANALNPSLGTTAFMFESISRGIKRSSPLILDNLGLTIKLGESYQAFADKTGVAVEALSAVDKQLALLEGTLEAGAILIEQAGDAAESAVDPFDRLTASMKNLGDAIASKDKAVKATAGFMATAASNAAILVGEYGLLKTSTLILGSTFTDFFNFFARENLPFDPVIDALAEIAEKEDALAETVERRSENIKKANELIAQGLIGFDPEIERTNALLRIEEALLADVTGAAENWIDVFERSIKVTGAIEEITDTLTDLRAEEQRVEREIRNFGETFVGTKIEGTIAMLALKDELGGIQDEIASVTAAWDEQTKRMLFNMIQQRLAIDGFTTEEFSALRQLAGPEGFGLIDQAAFEFITRADELAGKLDDGGISVDRFVRELSGMQTELFNTGTDVDSLGTKLGLLPETISIEVKFTVSGFPDIPTDFGQGQQSTAGFHLGGHGRVPPGFPDDSFMVGLTSGEEFSVTRRGAVGEEQRRAGAGGGANITFVYNPTISTASEEEARRAIMPMVEAGYRKLEEERKL